MNIWRNDKRIAPNASNFPMITYDNPPRSAASIQHVTLFLLHYAAAQLGMGAQTLRVARSAARIAKCFGYSCHATFLSRHITMTLSSAGEMPVTMVGTVPHMGLSFRQLVALNKLSWQTLDEKLSLPEVKERYESIMAMPRFGANVLLWGAAIANAAFCRLFGGDFMAMLFVFAGTMAALAFRLFLERRHAAPCLSFMLAAFAASMLVTLATFSGASSTPQIAIGSSVLFLIPGVPMINSTLDLLTGYPLMAFSRLVRSGMLVSCIGLGLGSTLFVTNLEMGVSAPPAPISCGWAALLLDGFFAAIASMGFAVLSNPRISLMAWSGLLAALGHALRFFLLQTSGMGIITASLIAAFLIGIACVLLARRLHIPGEFFSFLALLPMIPGMYAYGVILSTIQFMTAPTVAEATPCLVELARCFLSVLSIMCAMAIGAIAPLLVRHFMAGDSTPPATRGKPIKA